MPRRVDVAADQLIGRLSVQVHGQVSKPVGKRRPEAARWLAVLGDPVCGFSIASTLGHDGVKV
jgi:hypothetical protein